MPRPARDDGLNKFQRYRTGLKAKGQRQLRLWVADPRQPGFRAEAQRQAVLLRGAPEEDEALAFIEATADFDEHRA
ncbi:MAG: antitoxin MazE-like protein [Rhodospirillaceae bacterium]